MTKAGLLQIFKFPCVFVNLTQMEALRDLRDIQYFAMTITWQYIVQLIYKKRVQ